MNRLEILLTCISALLVVLYHLYLVVTVRRTPRKTAIGMTNLMRKQWVETIMAERRDILAVQTLRNWVMASSLLASTAILIALGILNTVVRPSGFQEMSHAMNIAGTRSEILWVVKLMLLAVDFFLAFFNFTLTIRYFNHAGYGLGLPDTHTGAASHEFVTEVANHASLHYTIGMRCYYLTIPFLKDLQDLITHAAEAIDIYREILSDQLNLYNAIVSNRMNDIMKVLTIFAAIFIPLTFIAGIYGTNFDYLPELHFKYGYFVFWGVLIIVAAVMLLFFKKRRWL